MPPLILASASPRRRSLLAEHGYDFSVIPADIEEVAPQHLSPGETVLFNACAKAAHVAALHAEAIVVGVDTLVAFEGELLGKPGDMREAESMLQRLNGRSHEVYSGVSIRRRATGESRALIEMTRVHFRRLPLAKLRAYLARIQPLDKAGAYAAQENHGELIECVDGSFSNVVGLPMERLNSSLRAMLHHPEHQAPERLAVR